MTTSASKAQVQARYDGRANAELQGLEAFEPVSPAKAYFRARKLSTALALARFPSGTRLLEIGCSVGQFTVPLAQQGFEVWGMDLSPASVALAQRRAAAQGARGVHFVAGDAEELHQFTKHHFDGVVSFSTLRYVPRLSRSLKEIARVLKPGGVAILDFPNRWCPWFYVKSWLGSERHPSDHWYTAAALKRLFSQAGFRAIRLTPLLFTPTVAPAPLVPIFRGLDWVGERIPGVKQFAGILMVSATIAHRPE